MSDLMFYGVLRMPYKMAMENVMSRVQFYERAQTAADRVQAADMRIDVLERFVASCAEMVGETVVGDMLAANARAVLGGRDVQQERAAAPLTDAQIEAIYIATFNSAPGAVRQAGKPPRLVIDFVRALLAAAPQQAKPANSNSSEFDGIKTAAPVAALDDAIAGALFDMMGFLTTGEKRYTFSGYDDASPAVEALEAFAKKRGLNLSEANVEGWTAAIAAKAPK